MMEGSMVMKTRLNYMALISVLGLMTAMPAEAQSLDEMKAQLRAMQKRIEQLEAAQKRSQTAQ